MAWSTQRVLDLWTSQDVLSGTPPYLRTFAPGFAQVLTVCETAGMTLDDFNVALCIVNCGVGNDPVKVRAEFLMELESTFEAPPTSAGSIVFQAAVLPPPAPALVGTPQHILTARTALRRLRTTEKHKRGQRIARHAVTRIGRWRWVQGAPDSILPYRQQRTVDQATVGYHDLNGFRRWIQVGGAPPGPLAALNCRDAVLLLAYEAGVLSLGRLRATYISAEVAARRVLGGMFGDMLRRPVGQFSQPMLQNGSTAYLTYLDRIDSALTDYPRAVPVALDHGLIPQAGDVVFVPGTPPEHVCLSLGRRWSGGAPIDEVISLWHHRGGTLARLRLGDMGASLRFVPCPF